MTKKTVLITGGHLSPVLTILPELCQKNYNIVVLGRKTAFNNIKEPSLEYQLLHRYPGITFYPLKSGRLTKGQWHNLPHEIILFWQGLWQALKIINQQKPDLVLSFGGYLSVPVGLAAKIKHLPLRLHEQTISPGKANLFLARLANKIFVTFPASRVFFPQQKTAVSGIALRPEYQKQQKPANLHRTKKPLLLVMGGSSGSHSINVLIEQALPKLSQLGQVVHQIGDNQFADFNRLQKLANNNYYPLKYLQPENMGYFYHQADLVISRSGANTFFELLKFKLPAVLIPLPWSANHEQQKQADILAKHGVGLIFSQNQTSSQLVQTVSQALSKRQQLKKNYDNLTAYEQLIKQPKEFLNQLLN